jgi:hypothetical protein
MYSNFKSSEYGFTELATPCTIIAQYIFTQTTSFFAAVLLYYSYLQMSVTYIQILVYICQLKHSFEKVIKMKFWILALSKFVRFL